MTPAEYIALSSLQFEASVSLPLLGPFLSAMRNESLSAIKVLIGHKSVESPTGEVEYDTYGFGSLLKRVNAVIFSSFYESVSPWLEANLSTNVYAWPAVCNFGRVVRNAIAHRGHIHFKSPTAPPVTWHHLSYGPADTGKSIIGTELGLGDLFLISLEMDAELTALGAPV
jgi:hypothetical protein